MAATVEVKTGKRKLAEFVLSPLGAGKLLDAASGVG
jgi:hypothetical protein